MLSVFIPVVYNQNNHFEHKRGSNQRIHPLVFSHLLCILIRLVFRVMYRQHLCRSCRSRYQAVLIFSLTKKKKKRGGKRCLKSLQLNSYKSALAVVLQHNLCKAMALLSQNRFAVVGWFSDEEQLSSIRHAFFFFFNKWSEPTPSSYLSRSVGGFW